MLKKKEIGLLKSFLKIINSFWFFVNVFNILTSTLTADFSEMDMSWFCYTGKRPYKLMTVIKLLSLSINCHLCQNHVTL